MLHDPDRPLSLRVGSLSIELQPEGDGWHADPVECDELVGFVVGDLGLFVEAPSPQQSGFTASTPEAAVRAALEEIPGVIDEHRRALGEFKDRIEEVLRGG